MMMTPMMIVAVDHNDDKTNDNGHLIMPEKTSNEQYTPACVALRVHERYLANVVADHAEERA